MAKQAQRVEVTSFVLQTGWLSVVVFLNLRTQVRLICTMLCGPPPRARLLCGLRGGRGWGGGRCCRKDQKVTGTERMAKKWVCGLVSRLYIWRSSAEKAQGPVERETNKQLHRTLQFFSPPTLALRGGKQTGRKQAVFEESALCQALC